MTAAVTTPDLKSYLENQADRLKGSWPMMQDRLVLQEQSQRLGLSGDKFLSY